MNKNYYIKGSNKSLITDKELRLKKIIFFSCLDLMMLTTVKPDLSGHSKRIPKIGFQDRLPLYAGQKYCRMHSAILSTFIKLPFVFKAFILSIFEWLLKTCFTLVQPHSKFLKILAIPHS